MIKRKSKKGTTWRHVGEELGIMQKDGKIISNTDLSSISEQCLSSMYSRMKKRYTIE